MPIIIRLSIVRLQQSLQASISCQPCRNLPAKMCRGQSVVMDGKVYYGGGETEEADDLKNSYCYHVQCYDLLQDKWSILPQLRPPVRYFGLGQLDGHLVAIGGEMKSTNEGKFERSKCVQRLDGNAWRSDKIPPISSALLHPAVISHSSTLIVAGGEFFNEVARSVEIFRLGEDKWYKSLINFLPKASACCGLSIVASGSDDNYYALGGTNGQGNLNQALYISTGDLHYDSSEQDITYEPEDSLTLFINPQSPGPVAPSCWKKLPDTPTYSPAASILGGSLIALGGWDKADREGSKVKTSIMKYSSGTSSWIYIGDLPSPGLAKTTTAVLSPAEILLIGGWDGKSMSNAVYKLNLLLK